MQTKAIQRYVRITPRKCNQVLELIRGQSVEQAQVTLQFTPKLGARIVQKVLKSAVANALHEGKVRLEDLYVKEAIVGAGPTLKRWLPRAPGAAPRLCTSVRATCRSPWPRRSDLTWGRKRIRSGSGSAS
jgi:large subunit ribosomal protein L22